MRTRLLVLLFCATLASDVAGSIWRLPGDRVTAALILRDADLPADRPPATAMLRRLAGVVDVAEGPRLADLKRTLRGPDATLPDDETPLAIAWIHTLGRNGAGATHPIARTSAGDVLLGLRAHTHADRETSAPQVWRQLDAGRLRAAGFHWVDSVGNTPPQHLTPGDPTKLERPYTASPITLDRSETARRLPSRNGLRLGKLTRDLTTETYHARLPAAHDPNAASGLLVWISPTPSGIPPRSLWAGADDLGLILIGADNSGNQRPPADRFQLALDAVATAADRWLIDETRVYAVGMSGGGRMASVMWCNAPDVFTGAVGIVGLFSPHVLTIEGGRLTLTNDWPHRTIRDQIAWHRLAGMGGPPDFNHDEMAERTRRLTNEGYDVRFFTYDDMAHVMPEPDRFVEVIRWVDEPYRTRRDAATEEATKLLDAYLDQHGIQPPAIPEQFETLERITELAPWTKPAWIAADILGYPMAASVADPSD